MFAIFLIFLTSKEIKANSPHYMQGYFYSNLTHYGSWISIDYGVYAWRPTIINRTWAPYKMGRWVWTDYGWYWDSYEPFGYIVYHYGRWHYDDYYGWIWIPDYEWGPAWVEWRYDDFYIGWAPLPPYAIFKISVGIVYTHSYVIPIAHWHFVKFRYFGDPYVYNYYIPERTKYRVHSNTKYRNEYRYYNGRVRNEGVEFDFVRQRAGDSIRKRDIVITDDPRNIDISNRKNRDQITTFIADREKVNRDRESLRNVDVVRNERKTSLDLSRVELSETRNRSERVRNSENETTNKDSDKRDRFDRTDDVKETDRNLLDKRSNERKDFERRESERNETIKKENERLEIERKEIERRENESKNLERRSEIQREIRRTEPPLDRRNEQLNRERERNSIIEEQKRNFQREQRINEERSSDFERQTNRQNFTERRIEPKNDQGNSNRKYNNQRRNENYRNESNRNDLNSDRQQNSEQRQRTR